METTKELRIQAPEGYEIDKEKSTLEKIVFKKKAVKTLNSFDYDKFCSQAKTAIALLKILAVKQSYDADFIYDSEKNEDEQCRYAIIANALYDSKLSVEQFYIKLNNLPNEAKNGGERSFKMALAVIPAPVESTNYTSPLSFRTEEAAKSFLENNRELVEEFYSVRV